MLSVQDLHVYYGRIHALKGVSLEVNAGEIVALIGSNGAGKTTTLATLSGLLRPREGRITFEGHDLAHLPAHQIVRLGVVHCPEGRQVFARLTVAENLRLAAAHRTDREGVTRDLARVHALFPILAERRSQYAGTLSGGEQQMLAIARALMSRPRLLLLDEPSLGLAPMVVETIFRVIEALRRDGVTILLVEQNAYRALQLADRAYVMETGYIKVSGPAHALADDPAVKAAYLGG
ncbi:MAG: ABC transporter ATP-binding protein [Anaerolineae bacterium]|nr:ABC transporter ATP-binding protein [Candidatus Roseilinea sp.]MDW8451449.1 ABC transporter ATP-binding protein [Anaerolineae bacterium]